MHCSFCEEEKIVNLKVEGDVGAGAIWCDECYCNFDINDIPNYGEWLVWNEDLLLPNGFQMEDEHNKMGELLTEEVRKELGDEYKVRFSPSSSATMYAKLDT